MRQFCWIFLLVLASACGSDAYDAPDVSGISIDLRAQRFDESLALAARDTVLDGATVLRQAYPIFFDSVWLQLMLPGNFEAYDSAMVRAFTTEPSLANLLDSVLTAYPPDEKNPAWLADLTQAFRYAKYYFPKDTTPRLVTYVSELTLGNLTYGDELLGVGLDFYLGQGFQGYNPETFPQYVQRTMNREHIASRAMETWITNQLGDAPGQRMLDQMIHNGKLLYIKSKLLPHVADSAVFGFSAKQLDWLRGNEVPMWEHYLDQNLLYETSGKMIGKHIGVSPNVPGMPPEAPGGGANWVGMQIVKQYMERHPQLSLSDLISLRDAQTMLTESKYRPGR